MTGKKQSKYYSLHIRSPTPSVGPKIEDFLLTRGELTTRRRDTSGQISVCMLGQMNHMKNQLNPLLSGTPENQIIEDGTRGKVALRLFRRAPQTIDGNYQVITLFSLW